MAAARWIRSLALGAFLGGTLAAWACGTDAVDVDACRKIEEARCQRAPACAIPIEPPYSTSGSDVSECERYYDVACLHGLENGTTPSSAQLAACVAAIQGTGPTGNDCSVVATPASSPACAWLAPPAVADAAADVADASAEAE
jgi:hypothetical protein